jgi:acyl-CoA thioester hydrolase
MPFTHVRTFRVRYYECDAHAHLNNANYLRYMQESAFDASAAAGYDLARYNAMERLWLIRESQVEYLLPLHYNDRVAVKTWVADFRRVSSRRSYEFYRLPPDGTGNPDLEDAPLAARACTDWAFIDTAQERPAPIPAELAAAFYPEGAPERFPARAPFPDAPPPPPGAFKTRLGVAFGDIDGMRHVNNAVYLDYVTECSMQALAAHGWPWERLAAAGYGIFLRRNRIQYLQPALLGDELEVSTWVSDVRRATAQRHYAIRRAGDGALLARVSTLSVWVDLETGQPARFPREFLADFKPNMVT